MLFDVQLLGERLRRLASVRTWIAQGTGDEVCPETFARQLVAGLEAAGVPHTAYFFDAGHSAKSDGSASSRCLDCLECALIALIALIATRPSPTAVRPRVARKPRAARAPPPSRAARVLSDGARRCPCGGAVSKMLRKCVDEFTAGGTMASERE